MMKKYPKCIIFYSLTYSIWNKMSHPQCSLFIFDSQHLHIKRFIAVPISISKSEYTCSSFEINITKQITYFSVLILDFDPHEQKFFQVLYVRVIRHITFCTYINIRTVMISIFLGLSFWKRTTLLYEGIFHNF